MYGTTTTVNNIIIVRTAGRCEGGPSSLCSHPSHSCPYLVVLLRIMLPTRLLDPVPQDPAMPPPTDWTLVGNNQPQLEGLRSTEFVWGWAGTSTGCWT